MDDITAQALVFFLAGFDTTSTLLSFASHQLAVHPDVQSKLQEEIDTTLQQHGGQITHEAVHSMKYLDMVVSGEHVHWFSFNPGIPPLTISYISLRTINFPCFLPHSFPVPHVIE
jgi:hypothetical protein